jgi:hypothetical protein
MNSAICTLFEGHYHYGVGALANSLYKYGFRGTIYAGYRGKLPPWVIGGKEINGDTIFNAAEDLTLRFIPLRTSIHLTNYKPDFMLDVWNKLCPQAGSLFYFDPDITVKCRWTFLEEWVEAGVALCADVNGSMPPNHPIRHAWKQFYGPHGIKFYREPELYFNGGFVGVKREHVGFLHCWQRLQELMAPAIGGLQNVNIRDRTFLFFKTDQDALNVAAMAIEDPISPMGQEGMEFQPGGYVMSHAAGGVKPWKKKHVLSALTAVKPSSADKIFWDNVALPIRVYPDAVVRTHKTMIRIASLIARFYRQ